MQIHVNQPRPEDQQLMGSHILTFTNISLTTMYPNREPYSERQKQSLNPQQIGLQTTTACQMCSQVLTRGSVGFRGPATNGGGRGRGPGWAAPLKRGSGHMTRARGSGRAPRAGPEEAGTEAGTLASAVPGQELPGVGACKHT